MNHLRSYLNRYRSIDRYAPPKRLEKTFSDWWNRNLCSGESQALLAAQGFIHEIIPVIVVLRDIVVNAIKMEAAGRGRVVAAIGSGKLKTATLMIGTTLTFFYNVPFEFINISVAQILLYIAAILSIVSAVQYFNMNKALIFGKEEKTNS